MPVMLISCAKQLTGPPASRRRCASTTLGMTVARRPLIEEPDRGQPEISEPSLMLALGLALPLSH
jgi:hypothetical protein